MRQFVLTFFCLFFLAFNLISCAEEKYPPAKPLAAVAQDLKISTGGDHPSTCELQFTHSKTCITYQWEKMPTSTLYGTLIFNTFTLGPDGNTRIPQALRYTPEVNLFMPSMGHGSAPTSVIEITPGTYRVTNLFFMMPGVWEIRFQLKTNEKIVEDEAVATITF